MEEESSRFFIAIHVGAGYHAPSNEKSLKSAMNRACLAAASILQKGSHPCSCLDAVSAAIKVLEDDPCTNVGRGSNLTEDEDVECDASVMDGDSGAFGAVGAVPGVRNPIEIATLLAKEQMMGSSLLGRIPPMFLVGEGARKWAKSKGLISPVTEEDTEWLVTERAKAQWLKYRRMLDDAKARSDHSRKLSPSSPKVMILDTTSGIKLCSILDVIGSYNFICLSIGGSVFWSFLDRGEGFVALRVKLGSSFIGETSKCMKILFLVILHTYNVAHCYNYYFRLYNMRNTRHEV
ncbi:hypothetical protein ACHQM5_009762 [Ranunculus cassubicifolius]